MPGKSFLLTRRLTVCREDKFKSFQQDKERRQRINHWHVGCKLWNVVECDRPRTNPFGDAQKVR